jgi:hypothetical protein
MNHPIHKLAYVADINKQVVFIVKRSKGKFKCHSFEAGSAKAVSFTFAVGERGLSDGRIFKRRLIIIRECFLSSHTQLPCLQLPFAMNYFAR